MRGVVVKELTENKKLGIGVSATMAAQTTCPDTCPFRGAGCYAENGFLGFLTRKLNRAELTADEVIAQEAEGIKNLRAKHLPLRLHVVGDVTTDEQAKMLADACADRTGKTWTYTHSWRTVNRDAFGAVSVLASCENADDVRAAQARGYEAAMVVNTFESDKAHVRDGVTVIPCPNQTRGRTCAECKLCMDTSKLRGRVIGFAAHGDRKNTVIKQIL